MSINFNNGSSIQVHESDGCNYRSNPNILTYEKLLEMIEKIKPMQMPKAIKIKHPSFMKNVQMVIEDFAFEKENVYNGFVSPYTSLPIILDETIEKEWEAVYE